MEKLGIPYMGSKRKLASDILQKITQRHNGITDFYDLYWLGIFIVSFLISLLWAFNVSKIAISTTNQKLTYAVGAGCGAICGLIILQLILN